MGSHIRPEGWSNWNTTDYYKTARYAEYEDFGPGAATAGRVSWSKQLSDGEVKNITREKVLGSWKPGQ
jgi:pectinesterase